MKTTTFMTTIVGFFILSFSHVFSSELEGCWKDESTDQFNKLTKPVCFEKNTIHAAGMTLDIKERQQDGNKIKITYEVMNTTHILYLETLDENRVHMKFPQYQGYFKKQD